MAGENGNGTNGNGHNGNGAIIPEVMPYKPAGRPTLWKDEYVAEIEQLGFLGFTKKSIAASIGISFDCYLDWQHAHPEIREVYDRAKIKGAKAMAARIMKASEDPKFWTAAAWFLERTMPESFAAKQFLQVEHTNVMTDADIAAAVERLKIM